MWLTKACAHVKSHQQTDRRSIDAERKSSESHTAHSTLNVIFYIVICNFFLCLFARARAHCCAVLQHTTALSVSLLNTHQTNERKRTSCLWLSVFFQRIWNKTKHRIVVVCRILFWRREEEKNVCSSDVEPVGQPIHVTILPWIYCKSSRWLFVWRWNSIFDPTKRNHFSINNTTVLHVLCCFCCYFWAGTLIKMNE